MDGAKRKLLETTLQSGFDLPRFIILTRELLKKPQIKSNPAFTEAVLGQFRGSVKAYTDFGKYRDSDDKELLLLAVQLIRNDSVARSRAMQRNFVKDQLQKRNADAALVAFFEPNSPDWRLSFVKIDYNFVGSALEEEITPARRYSFLVGENEKSHTAMRQLAVIMADDRVSPTVAQIEETFNIEKVTNEFFQIYRDKYLELKECLEGQDDFLGMAEKLNFTTEEFAKKLMGQLSFLYFLQRKGWLGVKANPREIPAQIAEETLANKPYNYRDVFKKVYTLNKDKYIRNNTALSGLNNQQIHNLNQIFVGTPYEEKWGQGDKNFIRTIYYYADKTGRNFYREYLEPLFYQALNDERGGSTYYRPFNCLIPFLNGGLFQPIVNEYDINRASFEIPNNLFSNNNITKEGDKGDGILDVFDRYAFTVKEDEPLEKEVAVDPEMLGKVFENLLEVRDRKSKGAFYTPREIVHYMCQESLINYLVTETGIGYEDVNKLIRYGDIITDADNSRTASESGKFLLPESIRKNAKRVDEALEDIRIADPAVGSGAFPLGMINEIVRARMNLTDYLLSEQNPFHKNYGIPEERRAYNLKLKTIQHSIHAVDIERSAVDITKLRLWLSLVVDEENFSAIRPLPNLEYNIMCGNSLLEQFEGIKLFNESLLSQQVEIAATRDHNVEQMDIFTPQSQNILDAIYELEERFFDSSDDQEKNKLKAQIDKLEWELIEKSLIENGKTRELPRIREHKRLNSKPYFLWKLNFAKVFRDKGGFDVVIGNPPYVQIKQIPWDDRKIYEKLFSSAVGRFNLFYFFIEKASYLTRHNGISAFIVPDRLLLNTQCTQLRQWLLHDQEIVEIDSFDESVFKDAVVDSIIIIFRNKQRMSNYLRINNRILIKDLKNSCDTIPFAKFENSVNCQFELTYNSSISALIDRINSKSCMLGDIAEVKDGIIQGKVADKLFLKQPIDKKSKKILFGKDIVRYKSSFNDNWVNYKPDEMMKLEVIRRGEGVRHGLWMREPSIFERNKILTRQTADEIIAAFDNNWFYYSNTLHGTTITNKNFDPLYVLAILNSKLMTWYYRSTTSEQGKVFAQIKIILLKKLPILDISLKDQKPFVEVVDRIHTITNQDDYFDNISKVKLVDELKKRIDIMVYQAYGFSEEEVKIIENSNR